MPDKTAIRNKLIEYFRSTCDGTYSDETKDWDLDLRKTDDNPDPVGSLIEELSAELSLFLECED